MMSHPDPKTHLLQRGWIETKHENGIMWGHEADDVSVKLFGGGALRFYPSDTIDAADVYALSLLAEQTRKPDATASTVNDKSLADLSADELYLWKETVRQLLANDMAMEHAIADADTFIAALRKRSGATP